MFKTKEDEPEVYISIEELAKGFDNLPKISIATQKNLRKNKKITFTKIGRDVFYTKSWVEEYIKSNINKAED